MCSTFEESIILPSSKSKDHILLEIFIKKVSNPRFLDALYVLILVLRLGLKNIKPIILSSKIF